MDRRTLFPGITLPLLLVAPQLLLTVLFFLWPAVKAVQEAVTASNPFGTSTVFVGLDNFTSLFLDPTYRAAIWRTVWFCMAVTGVAMAGGLLFA